MMSGESYQVVGTASLAELEAALEGKPDDKSVLGALAQVTKALGDEAAAADYEARAK